MAGLNSLKWWDGQIWRPELQEVQAYAEEATSGLVATNLVLVSSATGVPAGNNITLTATLTDSSGSAIASKDIQFQHRVDGVWTDYGAVVTGNGSGVSAKTVALDITESFRAQFDTDSSYVGTTSQAITAKAQVLTEITQRFYATWSGVYTSFLAEDIIWDPYLLQSYQYGAKAYDNYRSLIGFLATDIQDFLAGVVTKTSVKISLGVHSPTNSPFPTSVLLGWHDYSTKPTGIGAIDMARIDEAQNTDYIPPNFGSGRLATELTGTDATAWINAFIAIDARGISIGPAPSTATRYVCQFDGEESSRKPWIEFTIEKYV